ncbi:type II secretion system F family protein [Gammaproteobacteria bacterium AS21]
MPVYSYQGRHCDGTMASGKMDAASQSDVIAKLDSQTITVLSISATKNAKAGNSKHAKRSAPTSIKLFERVTLDEVIMLSRQLASLTRAGVPIVAALRGLADTVKNNLVASNLDGVADNLEKGQELSKAIAQHPQLFSDLYISIVKVGENTGKIDDAFSQMSAYLTLERKTIRNLKQAVRYPTFVLSAIAIFMVIINIFVIPSFKDVFDTIGGQLPWQTLLLITVSDFSLAYWPLMLITVIVLGYVFSRWKKSTMGKLKWDKLKFSIPLIGAIFYRAALARFSRTFSVVLNAGMPIEKGLAVVSKAVDNDFVASKIQEMRIGIERGEGFTTAAKKTQLFTPLIMQMIAVGEETGRVDDMLAEVADFYEEEVEYKLLGLSSAIEPILIVIIAILVLILALGVFLPLWELSSAVNK